MQILIKILYIFFFFINNINKKMQKGETDPNVKNKTTVKELKRLIRQADDDSTSSSSSSDTTSSSSSSSSSSDTYSIYSTESTDYLVQML